jgi:hypothetical protein
MELKHRNRNSKNGRLLKVEGGGGNGGRDVNVVRMLKEG